MALQTDDEVQRSAEGSQDELNESLPESTLTAKEALEKLHKGQPVENVRIEKLVLKGEFAQPVRFKNVLLIKPVFEGCTFHEDVVFSRATIDRATFGKTNTFKKNLIFSGCTIVQTVLRCLNVQGELQAKYLRTDGRLVVKQSTFTGPATFWEAQFGGWVEFKDCEFQKPVDFRSIHVEQGLNLSRCTFRADVLFRGAVLTKKWDATGSRFEAFVDFSKAKLNDYVYLEGIEQGEKQQFAFHNTVGDRIHIRIDQLVNRLASEENGQYDQATHEYAFLKQVFSSLHRYEQEDWAFYRFKVNQRRTVQRSWWRPWTKALEFTEWLLLDHGCGYCTNPWRAVRTALLIMLFFAVIYALGIGKFRSPSIAFTDQPADSWPNRVVYSCFTSVVVFTSGPQGIKDAEDWMNIPLIVESLLGTFLWGLFIVAFGRKVIR